MERAESAAKSIDALVGKTISAASYDEDGSDERLDLTFTDGTSLAVVSWDYEGYSSGLYLNGGGINVES